MVRPRCLQFSPQGHSLTFSTRSLPWPGLCREGHQHLATRIPSLHLQPHAASKLDQSRLQPQHIRGRLSRLRLLISLFPTLRAPLKLHRCIYVILKINFFWKTLFKKSIKWHCFPFCIYLGNHLGKLVHSNRELS